MKNRTKSGFTLVELMTVISVLGILASVILVNMNGARTRSRDNAVFVQIASTQGLAFKCLTNGVAGVGLNTAPAESVNICSVAGYSVWPALTANSDWGYGGNFVWCQLTNEVACNPYVDGTCGGSRTNGAFCYRFINGADTGKTITCTQNGCKKSW